MNLAIKHHGVVKLGEFIPDDRSTYRTAIIAQEDKRVTVSISRERKDRSIQENSYFHGVILKVISDELGYTPQEVKGILKWVFKIPRTSELSTVEFEDFCTKIRTWASTDLNIFIPLPNEIDYN